MFKRVAHYEDVGITMDLQVKFNLISYSVAPHIHTHIYPTYASHTREALFYFSLEKDVHARCIALL